MAYTWKDLRRVSDADESDLPTVSVSSLRGVLEVSNIAFLALCVPRYPRGTGVHSNMALVFHLLCLHFHFELPLPAYFNPIGQI